MLQFTTDTTIWPTNNISERGVRPTKTQQKISGRLTSEDATQDRLDIRSYIDTARKHGHRPLDVLRSLFTGNPLATSPVLRPEPDPVHPASVLEPQLSYTFRDINDAHTRSLLSYRQQS